MVVVVYSSSTSQAPITGAVIAPSVISACSLSNELEDLATVRHRALENIADVYIQVVKFTASLSLSLALVRVNELVASQ